MKVNKKILARIILILLYICFLTATWLWLDYGKEWVYSLLGLKIMTFLVVWSAINA